MDTRYALIKSGKVVNVIMAEPEFIATIANEYDHCELLDTPEEQKVTGIGWEWDGTNFFQLVFSRYAILVDGVVDNITEATTSPGEGWILCGEAEKGWTYDGTAFNPPELVEDPRIWWLDEGPFKDRLGMDAPAIYSSSHSICKGVTGMLSGRKYFDMKDPKIKIMLDALIAAEQPAPDPFWPGSGPMTVEKRDRVLTTPTVEYERHIKGLPS